MPIKLIGRIDRFQGKVSVGDPEKPEELRRRQNCDKESLSKISRTLLREDIEE